ncbi:MAG TPA: hypothetical protein VED46_08815 [Alphaproteobacteria bacterium]|nr:hypothetical protein [Alphaproteobacteria bacterium]
MLQIEVEQGPQDGPGWCRLRLYGLGRPSNGVELMIRRAGAARVYLGHSDWQDSEAWLELAAVPEGAALVARLGPPHTLRLGKVATVEIRARLRGEIDQRTRLAWPAIILPAENDAGVDWPATQSSPTPSPAIAPVMDPVAPPPELRVDPATRLAPQGVPIRTALGLAAAMLALVSAAAVWWVLNRDVEEAARPASERAFTEEAVRSFLSADPDGSSTFAEAALFEAAGHPDLALLLYRHSARRGEPKAALAIGRMYDPEGFEPTKSAFAAPDAEQAATYYEQGAQAGEVEAQFRLGRLLLSGRTSGDADVEQGAFWLQRAAEQGSEAAQAALAELEKRVP